MTEQTGMNRTTLTATLDDAGRLHLDVPFGPGQAGQNVQVTVEPVQKTSSRTQDEWKIWVNSLAGSWLGDFERPPQGDYETREPLS